MKCVCSKPATIQIQYLAFCRAECAFNHFDRERFCAINSIYAVRSWTEHSAQSRRAETAEQIIDVLIQAANALNIFCYTMQQNS